MGNEDDFELEMLRQAALKSLTRNRAIKAVVKGPPQHNMVSSNNRNLIEIETNSFLNDPELCEEIVIAEGLDLDDSDCDEVIEEVMLSEGDEDELSARNSPASLKEADEGNRVDSIDGHSKVEAGAGQDEESSSDDDALSVASRYSLYEDEPKEEEAGKKIPPVRTAACKAANVNASPNSGRVNNQRRSPPFRDRDKDRSRSPLPFQGSTNKRRRRSSRSKSRSRSPFRRRPVRRSRSRSFERDRTFRRRSISREPLPVAARDKARRKDEGRRPLRISPSSPPPKSFRSRDPPSRPRKSRSKSRERHRNPDVPVRTSSSKKQDARDSTGDSRKSSSEREREPRPASGAEQTVLENRRRKFLDRPSLNKVEGKKIRLHSNVVVPQLDKDSLKSSVESGSIKSRLGVSKSVQKPADRSSRSASPPRSKSSSAESKKSTKKRSTGGKTLESRSKRSSEEENRSGSGETVKVVLEEEEDLRAKLIKRKMKQQQGQGHGGTGRIFSEALKGTRLFSPDGEPSSQRGLKVKRKVSLTF